MIRRYQLKIIAIILGVFLFVFIAVLFFLNFSVYQTSARRAEEHMSLVLENNGFPYPPIYASIPMYDRYGSDILASPETMRVRRFFYARLDHNGNTLELNLDMMFDFSLDDAQRYITSAFGHNRQRGNVYNFSFMTAEKPYGQMIVFAERSIELHLLEQLNATSFWVAGIVSLIFSCFAFFLSRWMVAPIKNSLFKQRRFLSDAGHELKTPLTIIGANIDVLQNEIGRNQRLEHIKFQSERMNGLIHALLSLAKIDEGQPDIVRGSFNLSSAVLNTILEFESHAFEESKQYTYSIKEDISYVGDEKQIKQLVGILIDNAILYSDKDGQINASLTTEKNRICISVFNTGIGIPDKEYDKIFERFYRTDQSRSRETGGYGIGLSIAKAIVNAHNGKIVVSGKYMNWIRFETIL